MYFCRTEQNFCRGYQSLHFQPGLPPSGPLPYSDPLLKPKGKCAKINPGKCNPWRAAPCVNLGQIFLSGSVTAAVIQWHWAESSPTEYIALHINRYISTLCDGDDRSERERSSFGPESILAKKSLRMSSLLTFYFPLYIKKKKKGAEKSIQSHHAWLTNWIRHGIFGLLFNWAFFKEKIIFFTCPNTLKNQIDC